MEKKFRRTEEVPMIMVLLQFTNFTAARKPKRHICLLFSDVISKWPNNRRYRFGYRDDTFFWFLSGIPRLSLLPQMFSNMGFFPVRCAAKSNRNHAFSILSFLNYASSLYLHFPVRWNAEMIADCNVIILPNYLTSCLLFSLIPCAGECKWNAY